MVFCLVYGTNFIYELQYLDEVFEFEYMLQPFDVNYLFDLPIVICGRRMFISSSVMVSSPTDKRLFSFDVS